MRGRIAISILIGAASGLFCFFLLHRLHHGGDFRWAVHLAQQWLTHRNPYDTPYEQYPFVAAVFALPFSWLSTDIAAGLFYGISSGLLAFGLTRNGYQRLLVFLAYPYWIALLYAQWTPLIMASAFFPLLLPVTMIKPQVGIPVFLTRLSKPGFWGCVAIAAVSLALFPRWPWAWLDQAHNYQHFIAILILPGPLVLLAFVRYWDRDAWLLLLSACLPQRWFFDSFVLWLIPQTRRQILATVFFSWCAGLWRWYHPPHTFVDVGRLVVIFTYLPMLGIVLLRKRDYSEEV